jgi:hypothetical protein
MKSSVVKSRCILKFFSLNLKTWEISVKNISIITSLSWKSIAGFQLLGLGGIEGANLPYSGDPNTDPKQAVWKSSQLWVNQNASSNSLS